MGLTYLFYPGGGNAAVELGDDAIGHRVSGGYPGFDPKTEVVQYANANFPLLIEHGNAVQSMTWRVDRNHGTVDAAQIFKDTHAQGIPVIIGLAAGVLQELQDDGTTRYFQNCTRPKMKCVSWDGQSTIFEYSVQYGNVTQNQSGTIT
jgi:hypothetical protein